MKILIYFTLFSFLFSSPSQKVFELGEKNYKAGSFEKSKNIFLELPQSSESFHNVANSLYHLWDISWALSYYQDSLSLEENTLTRNNYEFIKSLLEKENQQQNSETEKPQQEQNQGSWSGSQEWESTQEGQNSQWDNSQDSQESRDTNTLSSERDEQYKLWQEKKVDELSDSEKKQLEDYIDRLQKQEQQQRDSFGKLWENNQQDFGSSLFDQFFWDTIFSNDLWKTEKDW